AALVAKARASKLLPDAQLATPKTPDLPVSTAQLDGGDPASQTATAALQRWAGAFAPGEARVKVKLLSAELDDSQFVTLARIEASGPAADGERQLQYIGAWRVQWTTDDDQPEQIREIRALQARTVTTPQTWFADVTSDLLPEALRSKTDLQRGGEFWPDYLDHVGETTRMGHQGIALGDVNGDGREDLYIAMCGGLPNLLLVQQPDGSFVDAAETAKVAFLDDTKGVLFADMDNDGDRDLIAAIGPIVLLALNNGSGVFDQIVQMRAPTNGAFYHLAVADFDQDDDLDIYGCRYVEDAFAASVPMPYHDANNGPPNILFRNEGDLEFVDATAALGLDANNRKFSVAAAWADVDSDGDLDLYVANDFGRNNLYRNDAGRFVDVAAEAGVEDQAAGMGVAFADVDEDGDLDLYVTNMFSSAGQRIAWQSRFQRELDPAQRQAIQEHALGNSLFLNRGDGTFERAPDPSVRMGRWGWGARFCDFNDDGRSDILAPNGFLTGQSAADC
ncbi:MAG: VCBS repeat-containing protein, partial [Planctomycetota bacterium]|nr:VCBS repeat-containing protein [Planctomycetota bacterium]